MTRSERLTAILDLLAQTGRIEVEDLVNKLQISPATARRDLDSLAAERLLSRTRGGAVAGSVAYDLPVRYNRDDHAQQKHQIALAASALIPLGAVIGLCGGTTSTALAQVLSTREDLAEPSNKPTLTVVTNAINIAAQLAVRPNFKIMVSGGIVNPRSYELVGPYTDIILQKVALDFAFIGVNGIDPEVGPTVTDEGEATVNSLMARRAADAYMLADSSKIGQRAFATMEGYHFRRLITDSGVTQEQISAFAANDIDVLVAPEA
ncbi:DeoR family transcriptional regulator of aga operon [Psychromicrobium silvestre]|uniref:DeoR family transcriptional regulator of aga operon n=1 Tax=Psychromicrobium silvestre TaxID=1645614 RepID=A0A7Y9LSU4_9MICC|nr:DeoR/GlpR family DNA-binding transcription regulator [Psychromicrobium silvestre]NYE94948.1 DeoR family transcriptional regulator of aga operon [Psychromicrobium silvestre]